MKFKDVFYINLSFPVGQTQQQFPFFLGYVGKDGVYYDIEETCEKAGDEYGLTALQYPNGLVIPILTEGDANEPFCFKDEVEGVEVEFDTQEEFNGYYYKTVNFVKSQAFKQYTDGRVYDINGTCICIPAPQPVAVESSKPYVPTPPPEPVVDEEQLSTESEVEETSFNEPPTDETSAKVSELPTEEPMSEEEPPVEEEQLPVVNDTLLKGFKDLDKETVFEKPVKEVETEDNRSSEEIMNDALAEASVEVEEVAVNDTSLDFLKDEDSTSVEVPSPQTEEDGLSLTSIDANINAEEIKGEVEEPSKSTPTEPELIPSEPEPTESDQHSIETSESEVSEPKIAEHNITSVTQEEVEAMRVKIVNGEEVEFIPRVIYRENLLYGLTEEMVTDLYHNTAQGVENTSIPQETILNIINHFDNCGYKLKVIFDTYRIEEILHILHFDVLDESPNGLYGGLFKALYLSYLYDMETGKSANYISIDLGTKMVNLATSTQQAIAIEEDAEDTESDKDTLSSPAVHIQTDIVNETNEALSEFISNTLLRTTIINEAGAKLKGIDTIKYMCKLGTQGLFFPLAESKFAKAADLKDLVLQFKQNAIHIYSGSIEVYPNVVGGLYKIYENNRKRYITDNNLFGDAIKDIPDVELEKNLNYNALLNKYKSMPEFKRFTSLSTYENLSEVANMELEIKYAIIFKIGDNIERKVPGFICVNRADVDSSRMYFIPQVGDFLGNLKELQVSFTQPVAIKRKPISDNRYLNMIFYSTAFFKENGIDIFKLPISSKKDITVESILEALRMKQQTGSIRVPNFVMNSAESVALGYKLIGISE